MDERFIMKFWEKGHANTFGKGLVAKENQKKMFLRFFFFFPYESWIPPF